MQIIVCDSTNGELTPILAEPISTYYSTQGNPLNRLQRVVVKKHK
jgi:hypothetical protein